MCHRKFLSPDATKAHPRQIKTAVVGASMSSTPTEFNVDCCHCLRSLFALRYLYPVDQNRQNEFGQSAASVEDAQQVRGHVCGGEAAEASFRIFSGGSLSTGPRLWTG